MLKKCLLASVFVLAASPAFADIGDCSEPYAPAAIDGNTASETQIKSALKDVKVFLADSDSYQLCLNSELGKLKEAAAKSKDHTPLDPSYEADVNARIKKNQDMKEKVGNEFNAAATAFNAKHPKSP